ncbi:hypothetical protein [Paracoccus tibetensis]|uniref:Chaperone modulatory protein CbpM n=1 Tax=Paracoccus tibetensis TaxID=336292 RepID=A0A1G5JGP4_9RHOB|nr:hypothetical protein [Paracoccus tibetensis]SCY86898.1 chaperone modulatory protein CbpM [Paracoccus tibetensis]
MIRLYSRHETLTEIAELDEARLEVLLAAHVVEPVDTAEGPRFREADLARLQLACDLEAISESPEDTAALVLSLIDEAGTLRADLRALMTALAGEPPEVRARLRARLAEALRR